MDNWRENRWTWKRAVRRDHRLSDAAKVLAAALCDDFANHETALCMWPLEVLAEGVAKSVRAVQRALAELRQAGWITVGDRGGRGVFSRIHFEKGDGTVAFSDRERVTVLAQARPERVTDVSPNADERVTDVVQNGDRSVTPYNKDEPKNNQKGRATGERPSPQCSVCIHPGTDREVEWDDWLTQRKFPRLRALGIPSSDASGRGWDAPFRVPPRADNRIEVAIAEKWANWATFRMMEKRSA